ncbi:MAG: C-GCAxxG-C-C family protein [Planctomycetes bacterium]|nr:C-GCAxxG-C-C family protein [Planctomycetota bacterium]
MGHVSLADQASRLAQELYEGVRGVHRSSAVAIAEAFSEEPDQFLSLHRGWLTGEGPCGAISAAMLVLGNSLSRAQEAGRDGLHAAMADLQERITTEVLEGEPISTPCARLVAPFREFDSPERRVFCARLVGRVGRILAEVIEARKGDLRLEAAG